MNGTADSAGPTLHVVSGDPEPEELAALVAIVAAHRTAAHRTAAHAAAAAPSLWGAKSRLVRPPLRAGPGAWRASALPR